MMTASHNASQREAGGVREGLCVYPGTPPAVSVAAVEGLESERAVS